MMWRAAFCVLAVFVAFVPPFSLAPTAREVSIGPEDNSDRSAAKRKASTRTELFFSPTMFATAPKSGSEGRNLLANAPPILSSRLSRVAAAETAPPPPGPAHAATGNEIAAGVKGLYGTGLPPWQADAVARPDPGLPRTSEALREALPARFFVAGNDPTDGDDSVTKPPRHSSAGAHTDGTSQLPIATGRISVRLHYSKSVQVGGEFAEVVIGSSEIADVIPMSDRAVYLLGKKIGATNLSFYNSKRRLLGVLDVDVTPDLLAMQQRIRGAAQGLQGITVSYANAQIILGGTAPDTVAADRAIKIATAFSSTVVNAIEIRSPQQVLLEVRVLEASRNAGRELGVNFNARIAHGTGPSGQNPGVVTGNDSLIGNVTPYAVGVANLVSNSKLQIDASVQALEQKGLVRLLAEPNLTALSGSKASFLAGGEFPIPTAGEPNAATGISTATITFKKFGVMLEFEPTVLADRQINLKLSPEVSELDFTQGIQASGFSIPSVTVRRATTEIVLRDGQSFAIAGLLSHDLTQQVQQFPWLGSVPVLGALFRSQSYQRKETELLILVTAHLARPQTPATRTFTPLDKTVPGNDVDFFVNGQQEIAPPLHTGGALPDESQGFGPVIELPSESRRNSAQPRVDAF